MPPTALAEFFDVIGASVGSLFAHHFGHSARNVGLSARKLILIDPFPYWPKIQQVPALQGGAGLFLLKFRLHVQYGPEEGDVKLAELADVISQMPSDAGGLYLAAHAMPNARPIELLKRIHSENRAVMASRNIGSLYVDLVKRIAPFHSIETGSPPAIMMALATERLPFYEDLYGTSGLDDRIGEDVYGPAVKPIWFQGQHFEVVFSCASNRHPDFTRAAEEFLGVKGK